MDTFGALYLAPKLILNKTKSATYIYTRRTTPWPKYKIENIPTQTKYRNFDDFGLRVPVIQKPFSPQSATSIVARAIVFVALTVPIEDISRLDWPPRCGRCGIYLRSLTGSESASHLPTFYYDVEKEGGREGGVHPSFTYMFFGFFDMKQEQHT